MSRMGTSHSYQAMMENKYKSEKIAQVLQSHKDDLPVLAHIERHNDIVTAWRESTFYDLYKQVEINFSIENNLTLVFTVQTNSIFHQLVHSKLLLESTFEKVMHKWHLKSIDIRVS